MADTKQSIRTCVLKVDVNCCSGCQKKVGEKLQTIPGVIGAEYNAEKGHMKVLGDVEPMTLVKKLTKLGKKAEIFSVNYHVDDDLSSDDEDEDSDDSTSALDPRNLEMMNMNTNKKKTGILKCLFGCFCRKSKVVQPFNMANRNWHVPSKFENGGPGFRGPGFRGPGFGGVFPLPNNSQWPPPYPMMPQYPPMFPNCPPMMQQQKQPQQQQQQQRTPMAGAVMPNNANMLWPILPQIQTQPYFMSSVPKPPPVNPALHYPAK